MWPDDSDSSTNWVWENPALDKGVVDEATGMCPLCHTSLGYHTTNCPKLIADKLATHAADDETCTNCDHEESEVDCTPTTLKVTCGYCGTDETVNIFGNVWACTHCSRAGIPFELTTGQLVISAKEPAHPHLFDQKPKLKNQQWDVTDLSKDYAPPPMYNEYDYPLDDDLNRDEALVHCIDSSFHSHERVMIQRGAVWDDDDQLGPWKQMFIGYAHRALEWAKDVTEA